MAPAMHEDRLPVQQLAILCMSLLRFLTLASHHLPAYFKPFKRFKRFMLQISPSLHRSLWETWLWLTFTFFSNMPLCRARCSDECKPLSPRNDRKLRRQARRGCEVGWAHQCDFFGGAMFDGYAVGARYVDSLTTINVSVSH